MMRAALALVLVLGSSPIRAAALTISDDAFFETQWNAGEVLDTSGAATFTSSQQPAGGDPGEFRQTVHSIPSAGQSIIVAHVFTGAQYDPELDGEIESIDFALDLRFIGGSVGTSLVGYQLVLEQAGSLYNALATAGAVAQGPGNGLPGAWSSHSFAGLVASSFTRVSGAGPTNPDFSLGGASLRFGYMTQNTALDSAIATTSGIDDWSVTIHPAPEPRGLTLAMAACLGLSIARRRARVTAR